MSTLERDITGLAGLSLAELRTRWQTVFGAAAPAGVGHHLLASGLAWQIQAHRLGDVPARHRKALDDAHCVAALGYVALHPVRAQRVTRAPDGRWSNTRALIAGKDDQGVKVAPALERVGNFTAFLGEAFDEALTYAALRKAESVGRPIGSPHWLAEMKATTGKQLAPKRRGTTPCLGI